MSPVCLQRPQKFIVSRQGGGMGKGGAHTDLKTAGLIYHNGLLLDDFFGHPKESSGILEALDVKNDRPRFFIASEVF